MYSEGTVIGDRYRLVGKIGEGGMATVWRAEHLTLGSPVAVKFLHQATGDSKSTADEVTERFMREARAAAKVRHRNVIEITDFGITDEKVPYMVLELLEGESLADRMDRVGPFDVHEAARLISLALRGLAAVHDQDIVHRDLKPENIFLVNDADGEFPKLLDFGVSKQAGTQAAATNITQEGFLIGTPDYMSPEQARGVRDIDRRTDIYSMGVILYELITGRLPFESENVGDLIVMITTQDPTPVMFVRPDCPAELVKVVETAMRRERDHRYQEAREMRRALLDAVEDASGFGDRWSGLTSISEIPPPPEGEATPSGGVRRPLVEDPVPVQTRRKHHELLDSDADTQPRIETHDPTPTGAQSAGGGGSSAGAAAMSLGGAVTAERTSTADTSRSGLRLAGTAALLVVGAVVGILIYEYWGSISASGEGEKAAAEQTAAVPWEPQGEGLPAAVADAGLDAGGITVRLRGVPDGGVVRVDDLVVHGEDIQLPTGMEHTIEVYAPDGRLWYRTTHPGDVDGEYQVWRMSRSDLDLPPLDAGAAEEDAQEQPQRRRTPRRRRRGP